MTLHQIRRLWQKHVLAENRRDIPGMLNTLVPQPTYIVMAIDEHYEGLEGVTRFYTTLFEAVPDATFELVTAFVSNEGVVEESILKGTHTGIPLFGFPPQGGKIALPLTIVFPLQGEKFWGERLYYDLGTLKRQLEG